MLVVEMRNPSGWEAELCRLYWEGADHPTALKPWKYPYVEVVRRVGLGHNRTREIIEANSYAFDPTRCCPVCDQPIVYHNRSDFQSHAFGEPRECRDCMAPRIEALQAEQRLKLEQRVKLTLDDTQAREALRQHDKHRANFAEVVDRRFKRLPSGIPPKSGGHTLDIAEESPSGGAEDGAAKLYGRARRETHGRVNLEMRNRLWITYAWADRNDVDFVAQELRAEGLDVRLDRVTIAAGLPLWPQIEEHITSPSGCDAWMIYASEAGLRSAACREELRYALDRALSARGEEFPLIALVPDEFDPSTMHAALRTRLGVSLTDPDWKLRVAAAATGRSPGFSPQAVAPYVCREHIMPYGEFVYEVRPRAGVWNPVAMAVPTAEKAVVLKMVPGSAGRVPDRSLPSLLMQNRGDDLTIQGLPGTWSYRSATSPDASPGRSYYLRCRTRPSAIAFGMFPTPLFVVSFAEDPKGKLAT